MSEASERKVLIVARPMAGGMRKHVEGLLKYLPESGYETILAGPEFIADRPSPIADRKAVKALLKRAEGIPIIHAHGARAGWVAAWALRDERPWVWTVHHLLLERNPLIRKSMRWIANCATLTITLSQSVEARLKELGAPSDRLRRTFGGIDLGDLSNRPDREKARAAFHVPMDRPVVLVAGRFVPEKGFDLAIKAMEEVWKQFPDAELWVAGEGPENSRLVKTAAASSRSGQVRFFGYWSEIAELYMSADVFIAPARQEGQGLALLEAMQCGVPAIAANVGGLAEVVQDGRNGLLSEPEDAESIGKAVCRSLADRDAAQRMAEQALQDLARFDIRKVAVETAKIYDEALGR